MEQATKTTEVMDESKTAPGAAWHRLLELTVYKKSVNQSGQAVSGNKDVPFLPANLQIYEGSG